MPIRHVANSAGTSETTSTTKATHLYSRSLLSHGPGHEPALRRNLLVILASRPPHQMTAPGRDVVRGSLCPPTMLLILPATRRALAGDWPRSARPLQRHKRRPPPPPHHAPLLGNGRLRARIEAQLCTLHDANKGGRCQRKKGYSRSDPTLAPRFVASSQSLI